jgi:GT2 family glycosyltransferase
MSRVLIGIVTHNRAELLVRAIESALAQDYPDKEVAVYDDDSSDGTSLLKARFPEVTWHQETPSIGYLEARNMFMRSDADFFVSLDDDAWFLKNDAVSQGVAFMKSHPEVAALAYEILTPQHPAAGPPALPHTTHVFVGCGHMLRLSAVREVGSYAHGPRKYGAEESDLCIRLLDHHYDIFSLPGVHVWHEVSPIARNVNRNYSSLVCNDLAFAYRRCPFPAIVWLLPAKMLRQLAFAIGHRLVAPYWSGLIDFFRALPAMKSGRRPVTRATFGEFRRRGRNGAQEG